MASVCGCRCPPGISDGTVTVVETVNAPGFGPPLHRHPLTEVFRGLEGRYRCTCHGREFETGFGDVDSIPGRAARIFVIFSEATARRRILMVPAMNGFPSRRRHGRRRANFLT